MNLSKSRPFKLPRITEILIGAFGLALAALLIASNASLFPVAAVLGVGVLILLPTGLILNAIALRLHKRNEGLAVERVLDGYFEKSTFNLIYKANNMKNDYRDMRRSLGQVRDSASRARLLIQITASEKSLDEHLDGLQRSIKSNRELRALAQRVKDNQLALDEIQDRLLRETSYLYAARHSIRTLVKSTQEDRKAVNSIVGT